ncbi:MAG: helix-turn-helix transcriptional regulator [Pontibacter sp.]|nr:helix-turn-helix transcriptional regulator [Pontibacter sp.]
MGLNLLSISDLLIFTQGLLLGLLFLSNNRGNRNANVLLGLFILTFNFGSLHSFFLNSGLAFKYYWLLGFPSLFLFWFGPLLYFYTASITQNEFSWKPAYGLWFIPAVVELVGNFVLLSLGGERLIRLASNETFIWGAAVLSFIASLYSVYFVIRALKLARKAVGRENFAPIKNKWLKYILGYFAIRFSFWSLYFAMAFTFAWGQDVTQYTYKVIGLFTAMDFIAIFSISFFSFRHTNEIHAVRKASYILTEDQKELYFGQVLHLMQSEKLYRRADIKLSDVAERLNTNVKYVSQLIKNRTGDSFTRFVNSYRIEEFKARIMDEKYRHLTMFAVAEECGFSSKATFNRVFKEITGVSPKEFRVDTVDSPQKKVSISENKAS